MPIKEAIKKNPLGLSASEARERLKQYDTNEVVRRKHEVSASKIM